MEVENEYALVLDWITRAFVFGGIILALSVLLYTMYQLDTGQVRMFGESAIEMVFIVLIPSVMLSFFSLARWDLTGRKYYFLLWPYKEL